MTDEEVTQKCADAMGTVVRPSPYGPQIAGTCISFDPLHNDAQALALVKKFPMTITAPYELDPTWEVNQQGGRYYKSPDLNRAICECVANMEHE